MFNPEKFGYEKILGLQKEPGTNIVALALLKAISEIHAKKAGLEVIGSVASEGPRIYIFNHRSMADVLDLSFAAIHFTKDTNENITLGRIPRTVGKSTLFGIPESEEIQERTMKKDILNSRNPYVQALVRYTIGNFLASCGVIPIIRGQNNPQVAETFDQTLKSGGTVATSIMESRDKSGGLNGLKRGAALLVQTHPDVPFQLIGISRNPARVVLGKPRTYAQIKEEQGKLNSRDLTMLLADGIVELLPERIQQRWKMGEREAGKRSLYSRQ